MVEYDEHTPTKTISRTKVMDLPLPNVAVLIQPSSHNLLKEAFNLTNITPRKTPSKSSVRKELTFENIPPLQVQQQMQYPINTNAPSKTIFSPGFYITPHDPNAAQNYLPPEPSQIMKQPQQTNSIPQPTNANAEDFWGVPQLQSFSTMVDILFEQTETLDPLELGKQINGEMGKPEFSGILNLLGALLAETSLVVRSICKVPLEVLTRVISSLSTLIKLGSNVNSFKIEKDTTEFYKVLISLRSSQVLLNLMTAENVPAAAIQEEAIEELLSTLKTHLFNHVLAIFDPSFRIQAKDKTNEDDEEEEEELEQEQDGIFSASNNATTQTPIKQQGRKKEKEPSSLKSIMGAVCGVIDRFQLLTTGHVLPDSLIFQITSLALPSFFVEGVQLLQLSCMNLARTLFAKYPAHRVVILEEVFTSLKKLPKSKKSKGTYILSEDNRSIQMVSALVLQLVQCCTALPSDTIENISNLNVEDQEVAYENPSSSQNSHSSFSGALNTGTQFLQSVLHRAAQKEHEASYRPVLDNLIQDLLMVLNRPEWPASEMLLHVLCNTLTSNINKQIDANSPLRLLCIDLLGTVTARLRVEILSIASQEDILGRKKSTKGKEDASYCICGRGDNGSLMIQCDLCTNWFHGPCVFVDPQNPPKGVWYCGTCQVRSNVASLKKEIARKRGEKESDASDEDVLRQIVLDYLTLRAQFEPSLVFCRQFYIALWYYEDTQRENTTSAAYFRSQWTTPSVSKQFSESLVVQRVGVQAAVRHLSFQRPLCRSFDNLLAVLRGILTQNMKSVRARGMKSILQVIEVDPEILADINIQTALQPRFLDESPSVRESTIALIGKCILLKPELTPRYYHQIADRIQDTSIAVRKRVIKILRDLALTQVGSHCEDTCYKLVLKVHESEEGVQELVLKSLHDLWFSDKGVEITSTFSNEPNNSVSLVPLPTPLASSNSSKKLYTIEMKARVEQMIGVVQKLENEEFFVYMVEQMLLKKDSLETKNEKVERVEKREKLEKDRNNSTCQRLCQQLVEMILSLEETKNRPKISTCISTLAIFARASPQLLVPHITTLHTYLKASAIGLPKEEARILQDTACIIGESIPFLEHADPAFLAQIETDLVSLAKTQSTPIIQSCIQALCKVVTISKHRTTIEDLLVTCYSTLESLKVLIGKNSKAGLKMDKSSVVKVVRSITIIGLLCRHYDLEKHGVHQHDASIKLIVRNSLKAGKVIDTLYNLVLMFNNYEELEVRIRTLQSIGNMFLRRPSLLELASARALISNSLKPEANSRIKDTILKSLSEFLFDEEQRAKEKMKIEQTKSEEAPFVSLEINSETEQVGEVMKEFLPSILNLLLDPDDRVRMGAVNAANLAIKHRIVNPLPCVPCLVSLSLCANDTSQSAIHSNPNSIQETTLQVLSYIDEKHPSFLMSGLLQGIKIAYSQAEKENSGKTKGFGPNIFSMSKLYGLAKHSSGSKRNFLSLLLKPFEQRPESQDEWYLLYMVKAAGHLPFTNSEEPISLVHTIDRIVSVTASSVLEFLKIRFPKESKNVDISDVEKDNVMNAGKIALAIIMLLELKRHLNRVYSLNSKRIQSGDSRVVQNSTSSDSFITESIPFIPLSKSTQYRKLYETLKRLLKEDEIGELNIFAGKDKKRKPQGERQTPVKVPSKKRRKVKSVQPLSDEEEDFSDDEEFIPIK